MDFRNTYEDAAYASSYAALEFPGTYWLAFRDLPAILRQHVTGARALDFGCGAGRSSRLLSRLGFTVTGVDISPEMIRLARAADPRGDYRLIADGDAVAPANVHFDLIFCGFPFDNIPTLDRKVTILESLAARLAQHGRLVNLVSSPEIYCHEWVSFSTRDFPGNHAARSGDVVRIINVHVDRQVPTEDVLWTADAYAETYRRAGLDVIETHRPLAGASDPGPWVNETTIPPWTIHVLARSAEEGARLP